MNELREIVVRRLEQQAMEAFQGPAFERLHAAVTSRRVDPYTAAEEIVAAVG